MIPSRLSTMDPFLFKFVCNLFIISVPFFALNEAQVQNRTIFNYNLTLSVRPLVQDPCDRDEMRWYSIQGHPEQFLYCDLKSGVFKNDFCASINGAQKLFNEELQQCIVPIRLDLTFNQGLQVAGSGRVSDTCMYNTDCLSGMFCNSGLCSCMTNYVLYEKYCYEKINPSQAGCVYNQQCAAVWPGSSCKKSGSSSQGTCTCPGEAPRAIETRDGWVCVQRADVCPLPQGGEQHAMLLYKGAESIEAQHFAQCNPESSDRKTAGNTASCHSEADGGDFMGEVYDCIPKSSNSEEGVCCPNRAFVCTLPQVSSGVGETRWWFNSVTQTCTQFSWSPPTGGSGSANANNFKTKEHCESYCKSNCDRGNPQFDGVSPWYRSKPISCAISSCDSEHECQSIGSQSRCCPKAAFICSRQGGLSSVPDFTQGILNYNPGVQNRVYDRVIRYYYDISSKTCRNFQWFQQGGNFNSFASKADCDGYCSRLLCERGNPLSDSNGNKQGCSNNAQCPGDYTCTNNVCCPRKQTICSMPKQVGTCGNYVQRFWYNAVTTDCELFTYSGCQGNANNFETMLDCQNYCRNIMPEPKCIQGQAYKDSYGNFFQCSAQAGLLKSCPPNYECYYDGFMWGCCPTKAFTCTLSVNVGVSCGPKSARWYYDTTSQSCQTFEYMGCDGNSNNFANRELCETFCGVGGCPNGGQPFRESNNQVIICSKNKVCPDTHQCTRVSVGTATVHYCCPTKAHICGLPPYQGSQCGANTLSRFYFNMASKECTTFTYNGCGSNGNNYATLSQCNNFCNSAACKLGETVYIDPNTQSVYSCTQGVSSSCPPGYACKYDNLSGKHVCCGSTDRGVCPKGEKAYIDAMTQDIRTCTPNLAGSCPGEFLCRFNVNKNMYYCCSADGGELCPNGRAVFRGMSKQPQNCRLGSSFDSGTCNSGYSCQTTVKGAFQGYCCSIESICPGGAKYYTEPTTGNPRMCTVGTGFNTCPEKHVCRRHSTASENLVTNGYCCEMTNVERRPKDICPKGLEAYTQNDMPQTCDPQFSRTSCPEGYGCSRYAPTGSHYCCGVSKTGGCPNATEVFRVRGDIKACSPFVDTSCPEGYSCMYVEKQSRYQCCGRPVPQKVDGCPEGQVAFLEPRIDQPRLCRPGADSVCPNGYMCQFSTSVNRYQCCGMSGGCMKNSVAYINPRSGTPQTCSPGRSICTTGFSCQSAMTGEFVCCSDLEVQTTPTPTKPPMERQAKCPKGMTPLSDGNGNDRECGVSKYCPSTHRCESSSNFDVSICCPLVDEAERICKKSVDYGSKCEGRFEESRYYFDQFEHSCTSFIYRGCFGNGNNFFSRSACESFCESIAESNVPMCPVVGDSPYKSDGKIKSCSGDADSRTCPKGYACQPSPAIRSHICCGGKVGGSGGGPRLHSRDPSCPLSGYELAHTNDGHYITCSTEQWMDCPSPSTCQYSFSTDSFACCQMVSVTERPIPQPRLVLTTMTSQPSIDQLFINAMTKAGTENANGRHSYELPMPARSKRTCPPGSNVYMSISSGQPKSCSKVYETCPIGYKCSYSPSLGEQYCCSVPEPPTTTQAPTPGGDSFGLDCMSKCIARLNNCAPSYDCLWHPDRAGYFCCRDMEIVQATKKPRPTYDLDYHAIRTTESYWKPTETDFDNSMIMMSRNTSNGCPHGEPFLYPHTSTPLVCLNQGAECPVSYRCVYSAVNRQFQCCSGGKDRPVGHAIITPGRMTTAGMTDNEGFKCYFKTKRACSRTDEANIDGCCLPKRRPAEACHHSKQCSLGYPGSRCLQQTCKCPLNMLAFISALDSTCVRMCPSGYINASGVCTKTHLFHDSFWARDSAQKTNRSKSISRK